MGNQESKVKSDGVDIRKFSHFPANDVREWFSYFSNHYPKGYMSREDFEALFQEFFPFGSTKNFCNSLFQTINIGQTGQLDFNELLIAFSILVKGSGFEKMRWIFRFYDRDHDGFISRGEMVSGVEDLLAMVSETIDYQKDAKTIVDEIFDELENESGFLAFSDFERLSEINHKNFKKISMFTD